MEIPFLAELSDSYAKELLVYSKIRRLNKRTPLCTAGDKLESFYLLMNGWVKVYTETVDGEESVVELLTRGALIGHELVMGGPAVQEYSMEVASDEVTLLEIPASALREALTHNSAVGRYLLSLLTVHVSKLRMHIEQLSTATAMQRTVQFLLRLYESDGKAFSLPCGKTQLASYLGMNRETFSRLLSSLKRHGVISRGGSIVIQNANQLRKHAGLSTQDMPMRRTAS